MGEWAKGDEGIMWIVKEDGKKEWRKKIGEMCMCVECVSMKREKRKKGWWGNKDKEKLEWMRLWWKKKRKNKWRKRREKEGKREKKEKV